MGLRDDLFHNRIDQLSEDDQRRFEVMLRINHFVNCAISDKRERASGNCIPIRFTEFLKRLRTAYIETVDKQERCKNVLVYDDFIRVADYSFEAVKEIVSNPSTHLEKITVKEQANKATNFGTKTAKWLAQRPGNTISEKISPQNKVLTSKTIFSVDTKENRELLYLYHVLREALTNRLDGIACTNCNETRDCKFYEWVRKAQRLQAMNTKIKASDLGMVKPAKQSQQNNKLMCDKNYKIVWDAVKMLSHIEDTIEEHLRADLEDNLIKLLYWLMLAELLDTPNIKIADTIGIVENERGLVFRPLNQEFESKMFNTMVIETDELGAFRNQYSLVLENRSISFIDIAHNSEIYHCDVCSLSNIGVGV